MKNLIKILLALIILLNLSCKGQVVRNDSNFFEISNFEYGKISLPYRQIDYLSKTLNIEKKHLTSSLYYRNENQLIAIPINDKIFNYEYFNKFDFNKHNKAKLYVQKYTFENKEYFIAVKIE